MPDLPPLELNLFTAEPLLRLLLALRGYDAEYFSVPEAWEAFKDFARLPTREEDRGATFQLYPSEGSDQQFEVFFGRQLTGLSGRGHRMARMVGVHLLMEIRGRTIEPEELWSEDFPDLASFFERVEAGPGMAVAREAPLFMVTWIREDE